MWGYGCCRGRYGHRYCQRGSVGSAAASAWFRRLGAAATATHVGAAASAAPDVGAAAASAPGLHPVRTLLTVGQRG
jgi:hypothetical protein